MLWPAQERLPGLELLAGADERDDFCVDQRIPCADHQPCHRSLQRRLQLPAARFRTIDVEEVGATVETEARREERHLVFEVVVEVGDTTSQRWSFERYLGTDIEGPRTFGMKVGIPIGKGRARKLSERQDS